MTVQQKIEQIVNTIGIGYLFAGWDEANIKMDAVTFPVCLDILPVSGTLQTKAGLFRDAPNCLLLFCDKSNIDYDAPSDQVIVERMKTYAMMFIEAVNNSGMFESVSTSTPYQVMYNRFDVTTTGVAISLTLQETAGICAEMLNERLKGLEHD